MSEKNGSAPCPDSIIDSHENRLSNIEEEFRQVTAQLVETAVKLEYLGKKVEESTAHLASKIEDCITPLSDKLISTAKEVELVSHQLTHSINPKINAIEARETKRVERMSNYKKAAIAIAIAGGGAVFKEFVVMGLKFFH